LPADLAPDFAGFADLPDFASFAGDFAALPPAGFSLPAVVSFWAGWPALAVAAPALAGLALAAAAG
jgi:hypothetical protein